MNFIKLVFLFWTCYFLLITNSYAVDMEILQEQCADIGFKIKTPANGKCVLQLMKSVASKEAKEAKEAAIQRAADEEQRAYENQRSAQRQQDTEMYELQRRSVAAQEEAARAQTEAINDQKRQRYLNQFNDGIQKMTGTGAYAPPPPRQPFNCIRNGNFTSCN